VTRHPVDLSGLRERVSATPDVAVAQRRTGEKRRGPDACATHEASVSDATLRGRQAWFARAVMTPEAIDAAATEPEAARILTAGPRLTALERLEIYRRAYHGRLIECLADDYPVLQHALGTDAFDHLCRTYIERHPSQSPNLNSYGRHMTALCAAEPASLQVPAGFCADLATLEWAIVEVIHAPSSAPLTLEGLQHVPAERWGDARLVGNTALRLLRFAFPVNAYLQADRDGHPLAIPGPEESATVVYRSGPTIWRMDLTTPMFDVLSALLAGEPLEAALGRAEASLAHLDEQQTIERVMFWFREWVSSGLFVGVELSPGPAA
jgi:Putative DNA-binding domain